MAAGAVVVVDGDLKFDFDSLKKLISLFLCLLPSEHQIHLHDDSVVVAAAVGFHCN